MAGFNGIVDSIKAEEAQMMRDRFQDITRVLDQLEDLGLNLQTKSSQQEQM